MDPPVERHDVLGEPLQPRLDAAGREQRGEQQHAGDEGDFRPYLAKELRATGLVRVGLEEASVKIRTGGPIDADDLPADVVIQAARTRAVASPSTMSRTASSTAGSASGATGLEK